jgi:hypothetical protein
MQRMRYTLHYSKLVMQHCVCVLYLLGGTANAALPLAPYASPAGTCSI